MSTNLKFRLTSAGQAAAWNASNTGIALELTHVQFGSGNRAPTGTETALVTPQAYVAIAAGNRVAPNQIRLGAMLTGASSFNIAEIGIWKGVPGQAGSVLFAYWSQASGVLGAKAPGVDFIFTHDMVLSDAVAAGSVAVVADTSQSAMLALMAKHEAKPDPHVGYLLESALELTAVPTQKIAPIICVTQPHLRVMIWSGSQYVRAPWHQPCQMFFSYDSPASIPGALPVRGDVSYQQANYPDLVARLGLSGNGTFTLAEARGEFIRVLDNGRGVDGGRSLGSWQEQQVQAHKHISSMGENLPNSHLFGRSSVAGYLGTQGGVDTNNYLYYTNDGTPYFSGTPNAPGVVGAETRPRNLAYPLWITY